MINNVVLTGRLTRNPELRVTQSGVNVTTFMLAVDRQFSNRDGKRDADFISCVLWRKVAENFCNYAYKGRLVGIEGRIQTRKYEDKNGQRVYVTEVVGNNFDLLDNKNSSQQAQKQPSQSGYGQSGRNYQSNNQNTSQSNYQANSDPFASQGDSIEVDDLDLPF